MGRHFICHFLYGTSGGSWPGSAAIFSAFTELFLGLRTLRLHPRLDPVFCLAFMRVICSLDRFCANWNSCPLLDRVFRHFDHASLVVAFLDTFSIAHLRRTVIVLHIDFAEYQLQATVIREGWGFFSSWSVPTPPLAPWTPPQSIAGEDAVED